MTQPAETPALPASVPAAGSAPPLGTGGADAQAQTSGQAPAEGADTPKVENGNREARYRVERNEARTERDQLAERVERMQRAEVERLAAGALSHPADLFSLSGNELADYLDDDGNVDAEKVAADVAAVVAERPGLRPAARAVDHSQGSGGNPPVKREPTFADLLRN